jgi:general secretion pathway protein A
MEELPPTYKTALVLNPALTREQLLRTIVAELGLKPGKRDKSGCLELLNAFLFEQAEEGNDVVVFIDEAQDLTPELLEEVRLLSNLETDQRKLVQIVLIGQPELRDKLNDPALRQLRQRITVRYHLRPLSRPDVERYVSHRLRIAGGNGNASTAAFTPWALWRVHRYARGIPRLVNAVCDKALLYGFVNHTSQLTGQSVRRAIRELEGRA